MTPSDDFLHDPKVRETAWKNVLDGDSCIALSSVASVEAAVREEEASPHMSVRRLLINKQIALETRNGRQTRAQARDVFDVISRWKPKIRSALDFILRKKESLFYLALNETNRNIFLSKYADALLRCAPTPLLLNEDLPTMILIDNIRKWERDFFQNGIQCIYRCNQ